jgi:hypothetical protein
MFHENLENLKNKILNHLPMFGINGFYYKDTLSFKNGGISDNYQLQFYIRPISKGGKKFTVTNDTNSSLTTIKSTYRIVVQYSDAIKFYISDLFDAISNDVNVIGWNDDKEEVLKLETDKNLHPRFNLISIDFEVFVETVNLCVSCN